MPSGVNAGHATYPDESVVKSTRPENVLVDALKSIFETVYALVSACMNAICLPSGENAGIPAFVMTESHPGAAIALPVFVS